MGRSFNTEGPVKPEKNYCIPPLERWDLEEVLNLIDNEKYFILHAPRQTGKTSALLALRDKLNLEGKYRALYINVEGAQAVREDLLEGNSIILNEIVKRCRQNLRDESPALINQEIRDQGGLSSGLNTILTRLSESGSKPLILFIDEIDSLIGDTLISVLRQVRAGYDSRPESFPQSIILCGVRDIKDYRIHASSEKEVITGGSAFNVKAESLRLGNFDYQDVESLLLQHTEETGQKFEDGVIEKVWNLTRGQPWLVNALANRLTFKIKENRDRTKNITVEMVEKAKEMLVLERVTHLLQLSDKLKEPRVKRVILPMLQGDESLSEVPPDDIEYVRDLGLIHYSGSQMAEISNPIYREVIPRDLTHSAQIMMVTPPHQVFIGPKGELVMEVLLSEFQQFFRENIESWCEGFDYKEAGFQLLLQAFLQRIINGGGRVYREYGLGRGRTDLLIYWPFTGGIQRSVIELKVLRKKDGPKKILKTGLEQSIAYADRCGAKEIHLMICDQRGGKSWKEKINRREETHEGKKVVVWGV